LRRLVQARQGLRATQNANAPLQHPRPIIPYARFSFASRTLGLGFALRYKIYLQHASVQGTHNFETLNASLPCNPSSSQLVSSRRHDDRRSGKQERSDESRSTRTPGGVSALHSDLIDLGVRAPARHTTFKNSGFAIDHNSARPPILLDHKTGSSLNNSSTCDVLLSTTRSPIR
jgi:hypothetical protein